MALPRDVMRNETWTLSILSDLSDLSALISGMAGSMMTGPSQLPATVFNLSKDFCASDWAKATAESEIRNTASTKRTDFIGILLKQSIWTCSGLGGWAAAHLLLYLTITLQTLSRDFLKSFWLVVFCILRESSGGSAVKLLAAGKALTAEFAEKGR